MRVGRIAATGVAACLTLALAPALVDGGAAVHPAAGTSPSPHASAPAPLRATPSHPPAAPDDDPRVASLRRDLEWILTAPRWASARWGVLAVSLDSGDTLFARNPHQPRTPASNVKLLTTAAALHYLGPDYRYPTWAMARGPVVGGRLRGDLILYGTGDPALSDRFHPSRSHALRSLARTLRSRGIHTVEGRVVGDGTFFRGTTRVESWDPTDLNEWFAAPVGALNFNENVVTLRIEPAGADGRPPRIHTLPRDEGLPVVNEAETGWGRVFVQRDHPRDPIRIVGSIPRGGRDAWRRLTVRDPARFAAQAFRQALEEEGIRVRGEARGLTSPGGSSVTERRLWAPALDSTAPRILAVHRSPPLLDILTVVNKESHNLLAETTLKTLGRVVEGAGTFEAGGRAVERFLTEVVGVAPGEVEVVDGSGLSALNRASPAVFVAVVDHMARSGHWSAFRSTLPEAGDRRELGRMYRTPAAGNLRAKTGTIEGVSSLSGIVSSASGERIAFSILGNGLPSSWAAKRNVEDRIGVRLAGFRRTAPAPRATPGPDGSSSGPEAPATQRALSADAAPPDGLDRSPRPRPRRR